jgi:glycosyltransferase involved in cell wall biosynthesis
MVVPSPVSAGSPRVAVIVPAYGVAHLVGEALASLQAQTLTEWECVVIDDGAPDNVAGAVAPFLSDPRFRFLATDNRGVATARNRAIEASTAPLIALLDGDDVLGPSYLEAVVSVLEAEPEVRFCTSNARIFGAVRVERLCFDGPQPEGSLANVLDRSFGVPIFTTFRRADWIEVGGFDAGLTLCEDFDLWVQLLTLGGRAHYCDAVHAHYRIRPGSASAGARRMLQGNVEVYEKAQATLPAAAPEQALIKSLLAEAREVLAFEHAIDRIIAADTVSGLAELRRMRARATGLFWTISFALWRLMPSLAPPLLRWRRQRHGHGYAHQNTVPNTST